MNYVKGDGMAEPLAAQCQINFFDKSSGKSHGRLGWIECHNTVIFFLRNPHNIPQTHWSKLVFSHTLVWR